MILRLTLVLVPFLIGCAVSHSLVSWPSATWDTNAAPLTPRTNTVPAPIYQPLP